MAEVRVMTGAQPAACVGDRRRRASRPQTLVAFSALFLALPLVNLGGAAYVLGIPVTEPIRVLQALPAVAVVLCFAPVVIGAGLLSAKRWGWWLFLAYAPTLCVYNVAVLAGSPTGYNTGALFQTIAVFAAVTYFLRRDVFAPYLAPAKRGWRRHGRDPIAMRVVVDGEERTTCNISDGGCFLEWSGCGLNPGDAIRIQFELSGKQFDLKCGVVRIEPGGVGVAFRGVDEAIRRSIHAELRVLAAR